MQRIDVNTEGGSYQVIVAQAIRDLRSFFPYTNGIVIAEKRLSSQVEAAALGLPVELLDGGETSKSLRVVESLYQTFLKSKLDKSAVVIAVGGGAFTDVVAFAAATYLRGIACIMVPTTLLAQVDASIGGKNGVNFGGAKNLIGTIVQPKLVLCDLNFLKSLPRAELSDGISEVIKAGVIADPSLFKMLAKSAQKVFALDETCLEDLITAALKVKAGVVSRDEHESNERMKLNLGHTIGHAIEVCCHLSHGQAVACGMVLESKLSNQLGLCSEDLVSEISALCKAYELPVEVPFDIDQVAALMLQDKKRQSDILRFALPRAIGQVDIVAVNINDIKKHLSNLRRA